MTGTARHVGLGVLAAAALLGAAGLLWQSSSPENERVEPVAGWPDTLSMTCTACGYQFELATKTYLGAIKARRGGKPSRLTCPECSGQGVQRTDNLERRPKRVGGGDA